MADYQTVTADTLWGQSVAWDMYKNLFAMNGLDGNGNSVPFVIHVPSGGSSGLQSNGMINLIDGLKCAFNTPHAAPDTVIHEMTHVVDKAFGTKSDNIKEGVADIFGTLGKLYANRTSPVSHSAACFIFCRKAPVATSIPRPKSRSLLTRSSCRGA